MRMKRDGTGAYVCPERLRCRCLRRERLWEDGRRACGATAGPSGEGAMCERATRGEQ